MIVSCGYLELDYQFQCDPRPSLRWMAGGQRHWVLLGIPDVSWECHTPGQSLLELRGRPGKTGARCQLVR